MQSSAEGELSSLLQAIRLHWGPSADVSQMPSQVLAYIGDAVYEAYVRLRLLSEGPARPNLLHRRAVSEVCAEAQARALEKVFAGLTEQEALVVRRGRNAHTHRVRKGSQASYARSTAFEALIGFLFLSGDHERLSQIMALSVPESKDC